MILNTMAVQKHDNALFLVVGGEGYGVRRVWEGLIRGFRKRDRGVTLAVLESDKVGRWQSIASDIEVISPSWRATPVAIKKSGLSKAVSLVRRSTSQVKVARWLRSYARKANITTIIVGSPQEVILAGLVARGTTIKVFWTLPNSVSSTYPLDLNRRIYRYLFNHMNVVPLSNSHYTDSTLGKGDFRRHVLHLGIDPARFSPDLPQTLSRADLGIPEDVPLLGLFARMTPEKGQRTLVEALARIPEPVHVVICGGPMDTPYAKDLQARVSELGLQDRVHFQGPQAEVVSYYQICDVVLNTRLDPEPFGMSVIESMAMEKPVLAHKAGGPSETVLDGQTGWLIDAPTVDAFAEGLARMLRDRARWPEMGRAGRARVHEHFSEDCMLERLDGYLAQRPA